MPLIDVWRAIRPHIGAAISDCRCRIHSPTEIGPDIARAKNHPMDRTIRVRGPRRAKFNDRQKKQTENSGERTSSSQHRCAPVRLWSQPRGQRRAQSVMAVTRGTITERKGPCKIAIRKCVGRSVAPPQLVPKSGSTRCLSRCKRARDGVARGVRCLLPGLDWQAAQRGQGSRTSTCAVL